MKSITIVGNKYIIREPSTGDVVITDTPSRYATAKQIKAATVAHEFAQYGIPEYDQNTGMYYWKDDPNDQYDAEDIGADAQAFGWPADTIAPLLELARLSAKLGITD